MPMTGESNAAASRLQDSGLGENLPQSLSTASRPAKALETLEKSPLLRDGSLAPGQKTPGTNTISD